MRCVRLRPTDHPEFPYPSLTRAVDSPHFYFNQITIIKLQTKRGKSGYHNFLEGFKSTDMLEISVILEEQIYCNSIVVINNGAITKTKTY